MPAWVKTDEEKYSWYKESILAGYDTYGFMVDYINPNTNEAWNGTNDVLRIKKFAKWIKGETKATIPDAKALSLYQKIKLVASDEANVAKDEVVEIMRSDQEFYNSVGVVGYHYRTADDNNGGMKWLADEKDKEVWNSEGQATFSNSAFRPANNVKDPDMAGTGIGGEGSARDPWSGWMHYDAGLLVLAHMSKFAVSGWENDNNTAGIWRGIPKASKASAVQPDNNNSVNGRNGGENYMTLASPNKDNFSTVIVNDSEYPMTYTLKTQNMNLSNQNLELWETRAADHGAFNENYMKCRGDITKNAQGGYTFEVKPYSVVTVTSLDVSGSKEHTEAMPIEGERTVLDTDSTGNKQNTEDGYLYADDFDYKGKTVPVLDGKGGFTGKTENYIAARGGNNGAMARYTHTTNGAFEVYRRKSGNYVLRQQLDEKTYGLGGAWNQGDAVTLIGDYRWTNYTASADVCFEKTVENQYAAIAIRQFGTSHKLPHGAGYTLKVMETGAWQLFRQKKEVAAGTFAADKLKAGTWFQLKLQGAGKKIRAYINNELVTEFEDVSPITAGRIALGSSYSFTQFDNLAVTKVKGYAPYYAELLDNMEMYDLSPQKNKKLEYNDKWIHANGKGMYVYQRSASDSTGAGAALTYTFRGTGLEIIGANKNSSKVNVTVDGSKIRENDAVQTSTELTTAYTVDGLDYGEHTVTVEVAEGSLCVDMVGVLGAAYEGDEVHVEPKGDYAPPLEETPAAVLKKGFTVNAGNGKYKVTDAAKKTVTYESVVKTNATSITIPATVNLTVDGKVFTCKVTAISARAFVKCKKLKSVSVGKNITSIGKEAFKNCKNLKNIKINSTVLKSIGKNAVKSIYKKAVIHCGSKAKAYKKLFSAKTGYKKTMKIKK